MLAKALWAKRTATSDLQAALTGWEDPAPVLLQWLPDCLWENVNMERIWNLLGGSYSLYFVTKQMWVDLEGLHGISFKAYLIKMASPIRDLSTGEGNWLRYIRPCIWGELVALMTDDCMYLSDFLKNRLLYSSWFLWCTFILSMLYYCVTRNMNIYI